MLGFGLDWVLGFGLVVLVSCLMRWFICFWLFAPFGVCWGDCLLGV